MAQNLMTVVEYCKYADISREQFYYHKNKGVLDGCFKKKPGYKKDFVIRKKADKFLSEKVSSMRRKCGNTVKVKVKNLEQKAEKRKPADDLSDIDGEVKSYLDETIGDLASLNKSQLEKRNELEKLLLAQIKRRDLENELINVSEVEKRAFAAGVQIREQLESITVRVAPLVAAETSDFECRMIIQKEVNQVLDGLSETLKATG